MVKLIMDAQGSGKTKELVASINEAVKNENGSIVCIEKGNKLRYDINYRVRLIDIEEYRTGDPDFLQGFLSGLHAGNFDITHVFIDSLTKIVGGVCDNDTEKFLDWLNAFGEKHNIKFTITISDDETLASEGVRKYF